MSLVQTQRTFLERARALQACSIELQKGAERVRDFDHLLLLADQHRSIINVQSDGRPSTPARFMCNMIASVVHHRIKSGMFIYTPPAKPKKVRPAKRPPSRAPWNPTPNSHAHRK